MKQILQPYIALDLIVATSEGELKTPQELKQTEAVKALKTTAVQRMTTAPVPPMETIPEAPQAKAKTNFDAILHPQPKLKTYAPVLRQA